MSQLQLVLGLVKMPLLHLLLMSGVLPQVPLAALEVSLEAAAAMALQPFCL